jgi:hypothetical protein
VTTSILLEALHWNVTIFLSKDRLKVERALSPEDRKSNEICNIFN